MRKGNILFFAALSSLCLVACANSGGNTSSGEPSQPSVQEPDPHVNVFVLSGQSNMEGSTTYDNGNDWLRKAFDRLNEEGENLDIYPFEDSEGKVSKNAPGIQNVLTSYYGFYPPNGADSAHASNEEDKLAGKFLPTNVAMGSQERFMGPEIGISCVLNEYATDENPIFLIKCAFSGSGFNGSGANWKNTDADSGYNPNNNLYETYFTPFVENNLRLIEDMGKVPVIKGFLWHQGETDTGNSKYQEQMSRMIARFRSDFSAYAPEENGDNITFIDGYIYDGPRSPYGADQDLNINKLKDQLAQENENNYVINTSYHHEDGQEKMMLNINPDIGDVEGGVDQFHYKTYDCVRLGLAYGRMIVDHIDL